MIAELSSTGFNPGITNPFRWKPSGLGLADKGLKDTAKTLLSGLERHGLIASDGECHPGPYGSENIEPEYELTDYGLRFLKRLAEPDDSRG
jgi:hypothetical protein